MLCRWQRLLRISFGGTSILKMLTISCCVWEVDLMQSCLPTCPLWLFTSWCTASYRTDTNLSPLPLGDIRPPLRHALKRSWQPHAEVGWCLSCLWRCSQPLPGIEVPVWSFRYLKHQRYSLKSNSNTGLKYLQIFNIFRQGVAAQLYLPC